jgi:VWFA-related protein
MRFRTEVGVAVVLAGLALSAQAPPPQQQPQHSPVFRGGTTVVPLTVTVVDQKGAPVKDLAASDFTVIENKKVREITNFFPQEFTAGRGPAGDVTPVRVREAGVKPQTQRTFLIVLGYGRIDHPTNALEGAIDLVNRLLPQDAVAVMGFHRTTVFTRDHHRIAQVLERYRKEHEKIVGEINNYRFMARAPVIKGSAPPGNAPIPDKILKRIDEIFLGPSPAGSDRRHVLRNTADLLLGMDRMVPVVEKPGQHQETFGSITKTLRDAGEPVTDEVLLSTKLKLYAGVEYLRGLEGDKQMVFFSGLDGGGTLAGSSYRPDGRGGTVMHATPGRHEAALNAASGASDGGMARDADEAAVIAQRASDARVVVNLIATNGTGRRSSGDPAGREVAELTGGYYSSLELATKAVAESMRRPDFRYLLGYEPSNRRSTAPFATCR